MVAGEDYEEGPPAKEEDVMKKIGEYTARGQVTHADVQKLELFDGRFDTGYRVTSFIIYPSGNSSTQDCAGILATDSGTLAGNTGANFSDQSQIAWSNVNVEVNYSASPANTIIDPDNLIVEDLYIQGQSNAGAGNVINYMITFEKYDITDWQGALAMVRNRSQT